jgi:hypothetical protein
MGRGKTATTDDEDRDGPETESILSAKGTVSTDDYQIDEEGSVGNVSAGEDSGDEETHLNMIAGLATSSLLTSNAFESATSSALPQNSSSKLFKSDDMDLLLGGSPSQLLVQGKMAQALGRTRQPVSEWESSFVLATGSNNGQVPPPLPSPPLSNQSSPVLQVFLYDLSSISSADKKLPVSEENDIDSAVVLPAWKILDGHQATGKAYGAVFTNSQGSANPASLVTYGSDGTLQIWSVVDER